MRRLVRGVALVGVAGAFSCSNGSSGSSGISTAAAAGEECSPFGNAPATVVADEIPGESIPLCLLGRRLGPWQDADGRDRYACLYEPPGTSTVAPLPLLVFVHPSEYPADSILATNLLELQNVTSLGDDPGQTGFIILAPQGRNTTHFYPAPDDQGLGWDNWYRQMSPQGALVGGAFYAENVDAAAIDHFIDEQTKTARVDPARIYLSGWSNGSAMAILYGLSRPQVAAIAVYSAPDPFHAFNDPCPQRPVVGEPANDRELHVANQRLPILHIHNDCDIAGICPNGERMADILRAEGIEIVDVLINSLLLPATECVDACGTNPDATFDPSTNSLGFTLGAANHSRWPQPTTIEMLQFLREHPLGGLQP